MKNVQRHAFVCSGINVLMKQNNCTKDRARTLYGWSIKRSNALPYLIENFVKV